LLNIRYYLMMDWFKSQW